MVYLKLKLPFEQITQLLSNKRIKVKIKEIFKTNTMESLSSDTNLQITGKVRINCLRQVMFKWQINIYLLVGVPKVMLIIRD